MRALGIIKDTISFYNTISQKFFRDAPKCFLSVVSLKIFSQILMLASFLVPIKVIFILALGTFKPIHIDYIQYEIATKEHLAVILVCIVFLITMIYFFVEKLLLKQNNICLNKVLLKTIKMSVYKKQNLLAEKIYLQYLNGLAGFIFFIVSCGIILILYPLVIAVFLAYLFILFLIMVFIYEKSIKIRISLEKEFLKSLNSVFSFGFLAVFVGLAYEVTKGLDSTQAIFIVISFILLRRSVDGLFSFLQSIKFLSNKKNQLLNIFFDKKRDVVTLNKNKELTTNIKSWHWVEDLIKKITKKEYCILEVNRFDVEISNEKVFFVKVLYDNQTKVFILKIFDENAELKANNEYLLLSNFQNNSHMPFLLGRALFDDCWCHLFSISREYKLVTNKEFQVMSEEFEKSFELMEVPSSLLNKYIVTHKLVYEKLFFYLQNNFIPIAEYEKRIVDEFLNNYETISTIVKKLPLRLSISGVNHKNCIFFNNELKLVSFGKWSIEPIGYSFFMDKRREKLIDAISNKENIQAINMVIILKKCETNLNQNQFSKLMKNLEDLIQLVKSAK